jgi:hypothetical protein
MDDDMDLEDNEANQEQEIQAFIDQPEVCVTQLSKNQNLFQKTTPTIYIDLF